MHLLRSWPLLIFLALLGCTSIDRMFTEPPLATSSVISFEDAPQGARDAFLQAHPDAVHHSVEAWTYQNGTVVYRFYYGDTYDQFDNAGKRVFGGVI